MLDDEIEMIKIEPALKIQPQKLHQQFKEQNKDPYKLNFDHNGKQIIILDTQNDFKRLAIAYHYFLDLNNNYELVKTIPAEQSSHEPEKKVQILSDQSGTQIFIFKK